MINNDPPDIINFEDIYNVIPKEVLKKVFSELNYDYENSLNGFSHSVRVLENALIISDMNGANKNILTVFSFFHDLGKNAAENNQDHAFNSLRYLEKYKDKILLSEDEYQKCFEACEKHSSETFSKDKDIATCWDADRLDLMRLGNYPDSERMNTYVAKQAGLIVVVNKNSLVNKIPNWGLKLKNDIFN